MDLTRLIYVSMKSSLAEGEIFRIQEQAQRNNARDELTGVLLFNRSYFLQYLEGDRAQITRTFFTIAADSRHSQVNILHVSDITERGYPDWSMGLLDSTSLSVRVALEEGLPGGLLMPMNLTSDSALRIFQQARTLHLTH